MRLPVTNCTNGKENKYRNGILYNIYFNFNKNETKKSHITQKILGANSGIVEVKGKRIADHEER